MQMANVNENFERLIIKILFDSLYRENKISKPEYKKLLSELELLII